jgi:hypothetical protein
MPSVDQDLKLQQIFMFDIIKLFPLSFLKYLIPILSDMIDNYVRYYVFDVDDISASIIHLQISYPCYRKVINRYGNHCLMEH